MRRGTTPTITITTDINLSEYTVFVTLKQGNISKDFTPYVEDYTLSVYLTQEDTLAFEGQKNVQIQVRAIDQSGNAIASNIMTTKVDEILKEGVIANADT